MRAPARLFVCFALAALASCAHMNPVKEMSIYQRRAETWIGAPAAKLRAACGDWNGTRRLPGGARQVVYSQSEMLTGVDLGCEARFTVSSRGTITKAQVSGTASGCRHLLEGAPARSG